jgi:hypothetical protein
MYNKPMIFPSSDGDRQFFSPWYILLMRPLCIFLNNAIDCFVNCFIYSILTSIFRGSNVVFKLSVSIAAFSLIGLK